MRGACGTEIELQLKEALRLVVEYTSSNFSGSFELLDGIVEGFAFVVPGVQLNGV